MKKLLLFIVLIIALSVFSNAENINECKTDVYYGNGVWNEYEDAENSRNDLEVRIVEDEIINRDPLKKAKYVHVKLAYNWGQGHVLDVLEVYYQLHESGQLDGIGFYTAIAALTVSYPHITFSAIATQALMEPFTRDWEAGNVDEMWQKYYNESFKLGHRVLLVSHSQGNLFANRIYDTIDPTRYKNYFANLQVASPASEVKAPKGDHVTLYGDPIINPIPGSMVGNANGSPGHAFGKAYLDQEDPYMKIVTKMKQLLETLDSESSQWETDQEYNKDTCDYKITVKHRFDPGIEMPLDVFPFAPNKKLYQLEGGQWIKASCGGTTIMGKDRDIPTWEGKQDNECLMIDNPEEEKIILEKVIKVYIIYKLSLFRDYRDYYANHYTHGAYVSDKKIDTVSNYYDLVDTSCHDERSATLYDNSYYGEATSLYIPRIEESFISTQGNIEEYYYYNRHYAITMPMMAVKNTLDCILEKNNKSLSDIKSIERVGKYNNLFAVEQPPTYWARFWFIEYVINMK